MENIKFVNEYGYSEDAIRGVVYAWWYGKHFKDYLISSIIIALLGVYFLISKNMMILIGLSCFVLLLILFEVKKFKSISLEKERVVLLHKGKPLIINVLVGEEGISISSPQASRYIGYSDIENLYESKSYIVLYCIGGVTVALSKSRFLKGSPDECLSYLKTRVLNKNKNSHL